MNTIELQVYDIFKLKFGEVEAAKVIEFIEYKSTSKVEAKAEIFEQIINKDVSNLRNEMKVDIAKLEGRLDTKISESKSELLKWMFIFWASQIAATVSFLMIYFKYIVK